MSTIVTRSGKGAALTHTEVDANFTNLNTDKAATADVILATQKGAVSGVCPLDATSKVAATYLPSYVDDVLEYANLAGFPVTGETGKIYVALDTNKTYRWSGSAYIYITSGAVDSVAGKTGVVTLTSTDVGLGNVTNTSDVNKPISTATQTALDLKAPLASPTLSNPTYTGTLTGGTGILNIGSGQVYKDASGNVGIGTSSPSKALHVYTNTGSGIYVEDSSAANASPTVRIRGWRTDTNGSQTFGGGLVLERKGGVATASGNVLGTIYFGGNYDTTPNFGYAASMSGVADGAFTSSTNTPTALTFYTGITPNLDTNNANVTTGTERMRIDSSGNVGIGTSSPSSGGKLFIVAADGGTALALQSGTGTLSYAAFGGSAFLQSNNSLTVGCVGASPFILRTNSLDRLTIDSSGNVGIGYATPTHRLHVVSGLDTQIRVSTPTNNFYFDMGRATADGLFQINGNQGAGYKWLNNGTEVMRIDSSGNVGIGTTSTTGVKLGVVGNIIRLTPPDDATSGFSFNNSSSNTTWQSMLAFKASIDGTNNFYVKGTGEGYFASNVGIGTSSPISNLDVIGSSYSRASSATGAGSAGAVANDFNSLPSYRATLLIQYNSASTGTTAGLSNVNLGILNFQNVTAGLINTNGGTPLVFGTVGTERMRIDPSGNVGIGTSSPSASAILDAQSTTKGVRFPNMTTTQKTAVATPAAGLVVFDTTLAKLCVYSGAAWQTITSV